MKHVILIIGLLALFGRLSGQEKNGLFLNEFYFSINRTALKDDNTEDRFGFGFGTAHAFRADKKLNFVFGMEFTKTSQFKKLMYGGHFANELDLTYNYHCLSIPVGLRYAIGNKTKIFIETGGYADLVINSTRKGIGHSIAPDENGHLTNTVYQIHGDANLSSAVGFYIGFGVRFPMPKFELVIKPDYKFGMNPIFSDLDNIYNRYFIIHVGLKIL